MFAHYLACYKPKAPKHKCSNSVSDLKVYEYRAPFLRLISYSTIPRTFSIFLMTTIMIFSVKYKQRTNDVKITHKITWYLRNFTGLQKLFKEV